MPLGCRHATARLLRGNRAGHFAGRCVSGVRTPCGNRVDVRRRVGGHCADITRLAALFLIRGWCLTKLNGFQFQKAARNHVRLNVPKLTQGCANAEALNGRSETRSGTEQVGSGMNGRRRRGAWFQERPLSARPSRYVRGDLSGWFLRNEESRPVKAPKGDFHLV